MRLDGPALVVGVPGADAVVEAGADLRPEAAEPVGVAADAPLAVDPHDAAELPVGGGRLVVHDGADRQAGAERLVAAIVLRRTEFGFAKGALHRRKEVRQRLGVVPDVGAAAEAAAVGVGASFVRPEPPVGLAEDRRRLEDGEVRRDGFDHLRWQGGVVEAVAEPLRGVTQRLVLRAPVVRHRVDVGEPTGVPRAIELLGRRHGVRGRGRVVAETEIGLRDVPRKTEHDGAHRPGVEGEGYEQRGAG